MLVLPVLVVHNGASARTTEQPRHMPSSRDRGRWGRRPSHTKEARMSVAMPRVMTRGVVFVHSTPAALCPHITWALESVLETRLSIEWTRQPAGASLVRAEFPWSGVQGTGAKLASTLRGW